MPGALLAVVEEDAPRQSTSKIDHRRNTFHASSNRRPRRGVPPARRQRCHVPVPPQDFDFQSPVQDYPANDDGGDEDDEDETYRRFEAKMQAMISEGQAALCSTPTAEDIELSLAEDEQERSFAASIANSSFSGAQAGRTRRLPTSSSEPVHLYNDAPSPARRYAGLPFSQSAHASPAGDPNPIPVAQDSSFTFSSSSMLRASALASHTTNPFARERAGDALSARFGPRRKP